MKNSLNVFTVFDAFATPKLVNNYSSEQWEGLVRILRGADLLASFFYLLQRSDLIKQVPLFALKHLESARVYADRQAHQVRHEAETLDTLMSTSNVKPIFLKGAAYVLRDNINHFGRVMSDIDILVKSEELETVEALLKKNSWATNVLDDYDQQYYRNWAHELPPYRHVYRGTTLDVHFTLLPPISGIEIDKCILFSEVQAVAGNKLVLSPNLLVLHCIIHLFFNEDFSKSFRDILDIHLLVEQLEASEGLEKIRMLAVQMGFYKELYYALSIRDEIFHTNCLQDNKFHCPSIPLITRFFIQYVVYRSVMPSHDLIFSYWNNFARFIMYIRGHFLKMPLRILIPHMLVKTKRLIVTSVMGAHHYEK
jgi:hypothetical protein